MMQAPAVGPGIPAAEARGEGPDERRAGASAARAHRACGGAFGSLQIISHNIHTSITISCKYRSISIQTQTIYIYIYIRSVLYTIYDILYTVPAPSECYLF